MVLQGKASGRGKRITQDALKDTSRTENESQTGCLVEQEVQDILRDWVDSHRGGVSRTQQFTDEQAARP